jgi:hypothetical protein
VIPQGVSTTMALSGVIRILIFFFLSIANEHGDMEVTEKTNYLTKHYEERQKCETNDLLQNIGVDL